MWNYPTGDGLREIAPHKTLPPLVEILIILPLILQQVEEKIRIETRDGLDQRVPQKPSL